MPIDKVHSVQKSGNPFQLSPFCLHYVCVGKVVYTFHFRWSRQICVTHGKIACEVLECDFLWKKIQRKVDTFEVGHTFCVTGSEIA